MLSDSNAGEINYAALFKRPDKMVLRAEDMFYIGTFQVALLINSKSKRSELRQNCLSSLARFLRPIIVEVVVSKQPEVVNTSSVHGNND